MFRELCPISHLPFRPLPTGEQGRGGRSAGCAAAISSALSFCTFRRASNSAMLGQSIRRFTTSVVRRSHYEEGPGKLVMVDQDFYPGSLVPELRYEEEHFKMCSLFEKRIKLLNSAS
ncbi:hypothetical protein J1605_016275 [Eschrichtius robustus]|uniref:Uncharacterized protein n=1 Tax=Eschrichtius robustus TaxID=9764 RepID=A0AB34G7A5_ESCRO|nr:hypothetical protein J1605_016275 [Eschrichtius robustus]